MNENSNILVKGFIEKLTLHSILSKSYNIHESIT